MSDVGDMGPGELVRVGQFLARAMRPVEGPRLPEPWPHLVAFLRERLAEHRADPGEPWPVVGRLVDLAADAYDPRAFEAGESVVDAEEVMWHLAAIWRGHPGFAAVLGLEHDRLVLARGRPMSVDRETWIREWKP